LTPVALDAMGGDHAPAAPVAGAVQAARRLDGKLLLVGDRAQIEAELARHGPVPSGLDIVPAGTSIGMDESPASALLRKRDASIMVAMDLVREGRAVGVVSAGNSGAVMGAAALRLRMLPGVDRPGIAMLLPARGGSIVVVDCGATVDPRPEHLVDFARMGSIYARCLFGIDRPRVGLLNIGEESSKGNALTKKTHELLSASSVSFVGNLEGQQIARGDAEVVVCDGFVGNVLLKAVEGYAELFWDMLKEHLSSGARSRLGALFLQPALRKWAKKLDYASYGGALLVGVNGICVIAHGRSTPAAIESAIRVARELAEHEVLATLVSSFGRRSPSEAETLGEELETQSEHRS
jgi:glycerol-3-phosphate acyltransferase PlsX